MKVFENIWAAAVERLSEQISKQAMDLWIRPIVPVSYVDFCAVLLVESPFQRDIIMSKYKDDISAVLTEIVGFDMSINVITPEEQTTSTPVKHTDAPKVKIENLVEPIYPEYTFNTFVVGESNKHAYAACSAVAKNPAKAYNPLFIYGNTGLGKTHLLKAIRNEIAINFPSYKTIYITGEEFTNELIENIRNKTMPEFKNKYRSIDVLFVDDIQFIANKDSTQEEFFHT
ncbi:MAG: AAA family ATPase, partial [Clostridia bacterium]|nr:AAA family ATPase [Clostridia bacterium]